MIIQINGYLHSFVFVFILHATKLVGYIGFTLSVCPSVCPSVLTKHHFCGYFWYSWYFCGYFGLCGWPHKTFSSDFMKCLYMPYVFNFLGKKNTHTHYGHLCVSKCPCMDWNKKTHKLWSFVSTCPCMDCRSYKTPLLWLFFGTVGTFVAILFICSHTKPIATQEKRHPNLWTKVATRHRFVGPSVCLSVNLSCPPCSICSSGWILSIFGTNDQ